MTEMVNQEIDAHIVILNNYIRRHHVQSYKALAKRVRKLTILLSVEMEPDRDWQPEWDGLDVHVLKNWMLTSRWKHSAGFEEDNFIHIPIDTTRHLRRLKPDVIFSYEMGMRSLFCSMYRRLNRNVPLVVVGNMSEHIERERGFLRRAMRKLLRMNVDYCTFNGPSCKRYLESIGFDEKQLFHLPYCFDLDKAYSGEKTFSTDGVARISYAGALSQRKGVVEFAHQLSRWCSKNPDRQVVFTMCGEGPLKNEIAKAAIANLELVFPGNCDNSQLRETLKNSDLSVFPTHADEWGLAPVEAMASGVPVIGSRYAQSMEQLCAEDETGWLFSPEDGAQTFEKIEAALSKGPNELQVMGQKARKSVEHITPAWTASKFCKIIEHVRKVSSSRTQEIAKAYIENSAAYAE